MLNKNKIAVISSGNAGQTFAAYFAAQGYEVTLYVRDAERVLMFPQDNLFTLTGVVSATAKISLISNVMRDVIKDAFLIMVTTPSQYHEVIANELATCLENGQTIVLNPGRTFGTYVFHKILDERGSKARVYLAEAETLLFTCRCETDGFPQLFGIKESVKLAAHNKHDTDHVVKTVSPIFPQFIAGDSTLETSFANVGMVLHPLPILMNITRIEAKEQFLYYKQGITPLVANILERFDKERLAVAAAYGTQVLSVKEWLGKHYLSEGDTLYDRIQNTDSYAEIHAPTDIDTRYIFEDVQTGCVPVYYAGKHVGVDTPIIESAIQWANTIYKIDFFQTGRNDKRIDFDALKMTIA